MMNLLSIEQYVNAVTYNCVRGSKRIRVILKYIVRTTITYDKDVMIKAFIQFVRTYCLSGAYVYVTYAIESTHLCTHKAR